MGLGAEFLKILKDTVKLTDSVERLNRANENLQGKIEQLDKRLVRLETVVELATSGKFKPLPKE